MDGDEGEPDFGPVSFMTPKGPHLHYGCLAGPNQLPTSTHATARANGDTN